MKTRNLSHFALGAALLLITAASHAAPQDHVYLTWQGDTSTTMTVNFHTPEKQDEVFVWYDQSSHDGNRVEYPSRAQGDSHQIPGLKDERYINSVELTGLTPGASYYFVVGDGLESTQEYKFKTIPNDGSPIRFISGGDMGVYPRTRHLLEQAGKCDPMFGVVGGDIPYANGELKAVHLWDKWLENWARYMVTSDGAMIPMLAAIGNHETNKEYDEPEKKAPFFYGFLPQGGKGYFRRAFGPEVVFYMLDSGHTHPHGGAQAEWLQNTMKADAAIPNKFAVYHVPLYPSHRDFDGAPSQAGREHWLPSFDQFGLTAGLENHDHTYKRTHPLKGNALDEKGTLYLGDGCFGVPPRTIDNEGAWYLANASSTAHFWLVEVTKTGNTYKAIDESGKVFDQCASKP